MSESKFWIDSGYLGKLAIGPRPRGNDWLDDEIVNLKKDGVDVVVCLLEESEVHELGLQNEEALCKNHDLIYVAFPIPDYSVPHSVLRTKEVCSQLSEYLKQDKSVFIHCRQGIGRSSIVAAVILVSTGKTMDGVLKRISEARNISVPETPEQKQWLKTHFGAG